MASIRVRPRSNGTTGFAVLYALNGVQTSATFDSEAAAVEFRDAVNTLGAERAMRAWEIAPTVQTVRKTGSGYTVAEWADHYIATRSGVTKSTLYDYRAYLRNDIRPTIGQIPLELLTYADVAGWVELMSKAGSSGKTIANKHGFLSAALNVAVTTGHIQSNPAAGTRLPRTEHKEMVFLTRDEFDQLRAGFTDYWHPFLDFLVHSGVRFGEAAALRPADVDRENGTVRIGRGFKRTYEPGNAYEIGPTKTRRSERIIDVDRDFLDPLDYTREYLFTNTKGGHLRVAGWRSNVWYPSLKRAQDLGLKKKPRIQDLRHTCASWMSADGIHPQQIQYQLGHESITTTMDRYSHLDRRNSAAAAARMASATREHRRKKTEKC
jgi:integrase